MERSAFTARVTLYRVLCSVDTAEIFTGESSGITAGAKSTVWRCVSRVLKKSSGIDCPARTIHEEVLQDAVVTAVNDAWSRKDVILPELRENIRSVLQEDTDAKLADIDAEVKQKQTELLDAGKDQSKIDVMQL